MSDRAAPLDVVIADIIRQETGASVLGLTPMKGGMVNKVYDVRLPHGHCVIRMNSDSFDIYRKEQWAMDRAAAQGILVPALYAVGRHEAFDYMIMEKIDGMPVADFRGDKAPLIRELGRMARIVNTIPVEGFGSYLDLSGPPRFTQSWQEVVAGDQEKIFGTDALARMGALSRDEFERARDFLEPMRNWKIPPTLAHSDISLNNAVRDKAGALYLIDWTQAKGGPAPMMDIGCFCTCGEPDAAQSFLQGYGIGAESYRAIKPDADRVGLSSVLDATCWAWGKNHPQMPKFIAGVRTAFGRIFAPARLPAPSLTPF